jgi:ribosomal protein S1
MSNILFTNVSNYTARNITINKLNKWSETGQSHKKELIEIVKEIQTKIHQSDSPSKAINLATKKLNHFFSKKEVRGGIYEINQRNLKFSLAFPEIAEEGIKFVLIKGNLNGRSKLADVTQIYPFSISVHGLQRLFERLGAQDDAIVLDEIYSSVDLAEPWHQAATESKAAYWILLSTNGFFVATKTEDLLETIIITWIKNESLSFRWNDTIKNLTHLKDNHPEKIKDPEFIKEFLFSYPRMLHEHKPGNTLTSLEWEQEQLEDQTSAMKIQHSNLINELINTNDENRYEIDKKNNANSYIPGLNYFSITPPFKKYTQFEGIIVQKQFDGGFIVGLKNGWVGKIPNKSIERGLSLITDFKEPNVGDTINVIIHSIKFWEQENAYLISLDPLIVHEASWFEVEKKLPVGTIIKGEIKVDISDKLFGIELETGDRGTVLKNNVLSFLDKSEHKNKNPLGLVIEFEVSGFKAAKKNLILSIPNENKNYYQELIKAHQIGQEVKGTVIRQIVNQNFSVVLLESGCEGLLHKYNNWNLNQPEIGDVIEAKIFQINQDTNELLVGRKISESLKCEFYFRSLTEEKWQEFINIYKINDLIDIQALHFIEKSKFFIVGTSLGISGSLPLSQIDWGYDTEEQKLAINLGDIIKAQIIKINYDKKKIVFSKKLAEIHPFDQIDYSLLKGVFKGKIISQTDYGFFVYLPNLKITTLLHKSKIPININLEKNQEIETIIDNIDLVEKKLSIMLNL